MSAAKPRRRSDIKVEALPDGSAVLYDQAAKMAYPLTVSAARIWQACDGTRTVATIVEELAATYDASAQVIERDVRAFLRHLDEVHLLAPETEVAE